MPICDGGARHPSPRRNATASPKIRVMSPIVLGDMNATIASELRQGLAYLDELWGRYEAAARRPIETGTLAEADDALPHARFVAMYATQALAYALDHLSAWQMLVDAGRIPIEAHVTLLRAALQGSVRCRWLVDATIDSRTRVARGYATRRDDQIERDKYEGSSEGGPRPAPASGKTAAERLVELEDARKATLDPVDPTVGIPIVGFTDDTSLMKTYGLERWFRLASAAAHGKEWVFGAASLAPSPDASTRPGVSHGAISANDDVVLGLTSAAIAAVAQAIAALEAYTSEPADRG
jgi:hypothetical protein